MEQSGAVPTESCKEEGPRADDLIAGKVKVHTLVDTAKIEKMCRNANDEAMARMSDRQWLRTDPSPESFGEPTIPACLSGWIGEMDEFYVRLSAGGAVKRSPNPSAPPCKD
ncbi:hypothetical protein pclt_cds_538 [Pandoravirus celtis]|uniref:Uncharacterized protein n=1 Tax=Pandoravirus celtis TaxID=2568002 RepID=A0A4D6EI74_9VIRU|nr:hypothetical protein pclt_cds_538 [Pandoravirus celtis]